MTGFGQRYLASLFIDTEISGAFFFLLIITGLTRGGLTLESRNDLVDPGIEITAVFGRSRDNERCACLVNQD